MIKQRPCRRFSVVKYAFPAFRYLVTGFVVLLLVLLLAELGRPSVRPSRTPTRRCPLPAISEVCYGHKRAREAVFYGGRELRSASYIPDLTLD